MEEEKKQKEMLENEFIEKGKLYESYYTDLFSIIYERNFGSKVSIFYG